MGGYITLAFAHLYPDMLEKFGLFHSSAFADNEEKVIARENAIGFIKLNGAAAFLKTMIPSLFSDVYKLNSYPVIEKLVESSVNFSPEALIQYYQAMIKRPDRTDVFQSFTRPILFIIGEKDRAIPLDQSLKQCYQPFISDIHLLPEAAHMGMMEDAVNCNNFIISFLSHC